MMNAEDEIEPSRGALGSLWTPRAPAERVELAACFLLCPQMFLLDTHSSWSLDSRCPCMD